MGGRPGRGGRASNQVVSQATGSLRVCFLHTARESKDLKPRAFIFVLRDPGRFDTSQVYLDERK